MTVKDFDIAVHPLLQVSSYTRPVASSFSTSFAAREAPQDSDANQSKSMDPDVYNITLSSRTHNAQKSRPQVDAIKAART